tara:strand:+ start:716 stop:880 length:165 start_codon:yes stop_codon:yes gene_type:complete
LNALAISLVGKNGWEAVINAPLVGGSYGTETPRGRSEAAEEVDLHELLSYSPWI